MPLMRVGRCKLWRNRPTVEACAYFPVTSVNLPAPRLARDEDAGGPMHLDHGTRAERQVLGTKHTGADFGEQCN